MNTTDWKDVLGKAFDMPVPTAEDSVPETDETASKGDAVQQQGARRLSIVLERKGRGGKGLCQDRRGVLLFQQGMQAAQRLADHQRTALLFRARRSCGKRLDRAGGHRAETLHAGTRDAAILFLP